VLGQLLSGGIPTKAELKDWGLAANSCCRFCRKVDSVQHRIFDEECGPPELLAARAEGKVYELNVEEGRTESIAEVNPTWFPQLPPAGSGGPELVVRASVGQHELVVEPGQLPVISKKEWGPLYGDGSCIAPAASYARAAAALCQTGANGGVHGPKPYTLIGFGDIHGPKTI
jgi:hypothetical protein